MRPPFLMLPVVAALFIGCADPTAPAAPQNVLMDLAVGNHWIGRTTGWSDVQTDTFRITGDTMVGTERWHLTSQSSSSGNPLGRMERPDFAFTYHRYLSNRADGLYAGMYPAGGNSGVERVIRYPVTMGDTIMDTGWLDIGNVGGGPGFRFREMVVVTALGQRITVGAGTFDAFKVEYRRMYDPAEPDGEVISSFDVAWFAPRAGLLRAEAYDSSGAISATWELIGLKID